ncbi:MAG: hypothetical protein MHMPM18_003402 [Marteilia pararefringens]
MLQEKCKTNTAATPAAVVAMSLMALGWPADTGAGALGGAAVLVGTEAFPADLLLPNPMEPLDPIPPIGLLPKPPDPPLLPMFILYCFAKQ